MRRLGSNDLCGLVSCTRYGDVDEALGPGWRRAGSPSLSSWYLLIFGQRDCGRCKRHYYVYHVWCVDQDNMKDFFEKVYDYQAKIMTL